LGYIENIGGGKYKVVKQKKPHIFVRL
jgi:hypothetical protein